jgi:hypothetical protein
MPIANQGATCACMHANIGCVLNKHWSGGTVLLWAHKNNVNSSKATRYNWNVCFSLRVGLDLGAEYIYIYIYYFFFKKIVLVFVV